MIWSSHLKSQYLLIIKLGNALKMTDNTLKTVHMKHLAQYLAQSKYQYISVFFEVTLCFSLLFSRSTISKSLVCPVAQVRLSEIGFDSSLPLTSRLPPSPLDSLYQVHSHLSLPFTTWLVVQATTLEMSLQSSPEASPCFQSFSLCQTYQKFQDKI